MSKIKYYLFVFLSFILVFLSATVIQAQDGYIPVTPGVKYQYLGKYDVNRLNKILTTEVAEFSPFKISYPPASYSVKLYRVLYDSVIPEQNNRRTIASGLMAIPETTNKTLPVVSYQHGTVWEKNEVPSFPEQSMETRLMIAEFAGQGYIVVAPDYFGKGISKENNSFSVKASTQQACIDMLSAAKTVSTKLNITMGQLFLSGWSQGSWSTMVFLNKLESLNIPVEATTISSAPLDLFSLVNRWIHAPQAIDAPYLPGFMAILLNAYEQYYEIPGLAASAIKTEYQKSSRDFYLNKLNWQQVESTMIRPLNDFLKPQFITDSSLGSNRFFELIQEHSAYLWRSSTPLHTYYGNIDELIPEAIATLPVTYQKTMGGAKVTAIAAGDEANHRGTFLYAVADQKKWFDTFLK
jgi:pimeloyl-ACP methyl ester carboxylesterase